MRPPERPGLPVRSATPLRWLGADAQARLLAEGTDAFRLADSPRLWVERFGAAGLISHTGDLPSDLPGEILRRSGGAIRTLFAKRLTQNPGASHAPHRILGESPLHRVREMDLIYEVDFSAGYSCGLFLDQRENRRCLRKLAPRRVLNCFAYTGSFSVAAAIVGAETWSLDISRATLARARRNFALNGLDVSAHKFLADDVLDVLPRLVRRNEKFDAIILDPPTFSRGRRGRVFRIEDDLPDLIRLAAACAIPGARILVSTNCSKIGRARLRSMIRSAVGEDVAMEQTPLPVDFSPEGTPATVFFRTGSIPAIMQ